MIIHMICHQTHQSPSATMCANEVQSNHCDYIEDEEGLVKEPTLKKEDEDEDEDEEGGLAKKTGSYSSFNTR